MSTEPQTNTAGPRRRRWLWRLGFSLAILCVWAWMGLYFLGQAIGSMDACYGVSEQVCRGEVHDAAVDANNWGTVFAACAFVASVLAVAAAEGRRPAAAGLAIFAVAVAVLTYDHPTWSTGQHTTGFMAVGLAPLAALTLWRWWSLRERAEKRTWTYRQ